MCELVALHLADSGRLKARLAEQKQVILALDGLQSDVGREPLADVGDEPGFAARVAKGAEVGDGGDVDNCCGELFSRFFIKFFIKKFCLPHVAPVYSITSFVDGRAKTAASGCLGKGEISFAFVYSRFHEFRLQHFGDQSRSGSTLLFDPKLLLI
jgi:hypothetical protein